VPEAALRAVRFASLLGSAAGGADRPGGSAGRWPGRLAVGEWRMGRERAWWWNGPTGSTLPARSC